MDAKNGFNELSRKCVMHTTRHVWPAGCLFAFNCYRHCAKLIMRQYGKDAYVILGREGVTQGDPLSMG